MNKLNNNDKAKSLEYIYNIYIPSTCTMTDMEPEIIRWATFDSFQDKDDARSM